MPTPRLLIVEDDDDLRALLAEEASEAAFEVQTAASSEEAQARISAASPDVIVSDLRLPGASGMDLLRQTRELALPPAFIVITAFGSIPQAVEALKAGADNFLTKPLDLDHFMLAVRRSLEAQQLRGQVRRLQKILGDDHFHGMIGRCQAMRVLFDHVRQVASARGPVLVVGESGVGKELVARALHEESDRCDRPFLAVNCAGVPHDLLESEFFGHEKGAFTGAHEQRQGLFMEANGGTLFLDEVTEMPPALQAKLLRVLQEQTVRPVGSAQEVSVDVRVVASSNRDLEQVVEEKQFRADLFYRLETFTLRVPPLRERGEDLDLLAAHFLKRFAARMEKEVERLNPAVMQRLRQYRFPGNVRELQNAIERAVTFCDGAEVRVAHLPARIREATINGNAPASPPEERRPGLVSADELPTLAEIERRYIEYVLSRLDNNKRRAADVLGIGRRTLYRKLETYNETEGDTT